MRKLLLASVFAVALPIAAHAVPITYDAVAQFSTASNPNGVWSYGYGTATAGSLTFTSFGTSFTNFGGNAGYNYWGLSANSVPLVGRNTSGATSNGTYQPPSNDLWLHPGDANNLSAIVRFTAAFTGSYSLSSLFERVDTVDGGGNGVGVSVYDNNIRLISTTIGTAYKTAFVFGGPVSLTAGDTLSFVVDRNGEYSYDSTGLRVTISSNDAPTAVPEPASMALLGTGLLGLGMIRRRKRA